MVGNARAPTVTQVVLTMVLVVHHFPNHFIAQQRLVNWLATPGFGWVHVLRMRHMAAMFRGSGVMWASQLRGSLRAIVSCVCRSLVCHVL